MSHAQLRCAQLSRARLRCAQLRRAQLRRAQLRRAQLHRAQLHRAQKVMAELPRADARVFFRDVTTLRTLGAVLIGQTVTMAPLLPRVVAELVSPLELLEFSGHYAMLAVYTLLHHAAQAAQLRSPVAIPN